MSGAGVPSRAAFIACVCLFFWLTEWLPVWIPTVMLWAATPLLLAQADDRFILSRVLEWSLDPVIALFLAGFAFAAAARQHGIDGKLARLAVRRSRGSSTRLIAAAALATALLSMWVSNVAAAALMFGAFRPIWSAEPAGSRLRRALLLSIALAANVGGIATPVGTGPNGIAMAAVAHQHTITFLHWMVFGVPLAFGLVAISIALVLFHLSPGPIPGSVGSSPTVSTRAAPGPYLRLGVVFCVTVVLWLTEPLHQIPAWMVALTSVLALLALRVLHVGSLVKIDWGTLLLVAGGIALGALLDRSGLVRDVAASLPFSEAPSMARLVALCLVCAGMSALMSNTGTVALLIPLAATFDPAPSTAIIIAVASSLGMTFVVSTPANAMAVASGLRSTDLIRPGLILLIGGCVLVAVTGPWILRATGIP
jgi:sodium-dependent dicarboxylate transporter 2/3/5